MVEIKELTFVAWKKSKPKKNLPKPRQNIHQKVSFVLWSIKTFSFKTMYVEWFR